MRISDWSSDVCSSDLDAHPLVGEPLERRTRGVAPRVVVVPPAGVERVAGEALDAGDARELRHVERARAHGHELGRERVASDGGDQPAGCVLVPPQVGDLRSEEHTSELQSLMRISYAVFCLKQKTTKQDNTN